MNVLSLRTFAAANSPSGFYSLFGDLLKNRRTYIIKGGPGTGKSSVMKTVAKAAYRHGYFAEYIYCSSDPQSLDAVYIPKLNTVICDGTAPHTADPEFAGSEGGIIDVGCFWDEKRLVRSKEDIRAFSQKIKDCYARAYRYLSAACDATTDISRLAEKHIKKEKLSAFIEDFTARFPEKEGVAFHHKRFLSAFSPEGFLTFRDTIYSAENVFVISDRYGLAMPILQALENKLHGHETYIFYNPLIPSRISHICVPELDIAVVTSSAMVAFEPQNTRRICFSRFLDCDISLDKNKIAFANKIARLCIDETVSCIKNAKNLHDDLEEIYIAAMDFDSVSKTAQELSDRIFT